MSNKSSLFISTLCDLFGSCVRGDIMFAASPQLSKVSMRTAETRVGNQVQTRKAAEYLISHSTRRLKFNHVPVTQINLFRFSCTWQLQKTVSAMWSMTCNDTIWRSGYDCRRTSSVTQLMNASVFGNVKMNFICFPTSFFFRSQNFNVHVMARKPGSGILKGS